MKMITSEVIELILQELDTYDDAKMHEESNRFLRQQPHLTQFLYEFTEGFQVEAQQLSLYLAYFLWKVCIRGWGKRIPGVTWQVCYHAFLKERKLWESSNGTFKKGTQPALITYLKTFLDHDHRSAFNKDLEKGMLLILLISILTAFERTTKTS